LPRGSIASLPGACVFPSDYLRKAWPSQSKITQSDQNYLKFLRRGLDPRDLDPKVVRNHRAVGEIELIEGDAVFVADLLRRADGQHSRSGFVLAPYGLCRRASCRLAARIVRWQQGDLLL
jgi:hypothetical protein